jgi:RimJ/RimL family protein N-acetyltransferase
MTLAPDHRDVSTERDLGRSSGVVILRGLEQADLPVLFEHQMDPEANRMAAFPARDRNAFMAHWAKVLVDDAVLKRTILLDGEIVGSIVRFEQSGESRIGYWIGREYWGKGIATRALSLFLKDIAARPLYARVAKHNTASVRVLTKCGFTICGEDRAFDGPNGETQEFILKLEGTEITGG